MFDYYEGTTYQSVPLYSMVFDHIQLTTGNVWLLRRDNIPKCFSPQYGLYSHSADKWGKRAVFEYYEETTYESAFADTVVFAHTQPTWEVNISSSFF